MFSDQVLSFYKNLSFKGKLPKGVTFMNPYQDKKAFGFCEQFYHKYYGDNETRTIILGINPGRFGGGITGVPFTDPMKLEDICGIPNDLQKKAELSADFIYKMIEAYGGPAGFYRKYFISALSPLGLLKDEKNLNYYDAPDLARVVEPFIVSCLKTQLSLPVRREMCFCLGEGENFRYLRKLNDEHKFFGKIVPLPHPRFIMQYRRKRADEFVDLYLQAFESAHA
jgi:hypothetical protein